MIASLIFIFSGFTAWSWWGRFVSIFVEFIGWLERTTATNHVFTTKGFVR